MEPIENDTKYAILGLLGGCGLAIVVINIVKYILEPHYIYTLEKDDLDNLLTKILFGVWGFSWLSGCLIDHFIYKNKIAKAELQSLNDKADKLER